MAEKTDPGAMQVIARKALVAFWEQYPDAEEHLAAWFRVASHADWAKWDVQVAYPKASLIEYCLVFNICGGAYRLVVRRSATWKTLFIVGVFTHADYNRDLWKVRCCS